MTGWFHRNVTRRLREKPRRSRQSSLFALLTAAALCSFTDTAEAQFRCRVAVNPFAFGTYAPGNPTPHDVTGNIDVRCMGQPGFFTATLSTGSSGSFAQRQMLSGATPMAYNLYIDPARTLVWGDGTGGSLTLFRRKTRFGRQNFTLPVYGRIPPTQSVSPGLYSDDIVVTIVF